MVRIDMIGPVALGVTIGTLLGEILALALSSCTQANITPGEARAIARDAYIYGFPLVDNYRIQYACFVDRDNPADHEHS